MIIEKIADLLYNLVFYSSNLPGASGVLGSMLGESL
jgi:hypothetical protein